MWGTCVAFGGSTLGAVTSFMLVEMGDDDGDNMTRTETCVRYRRRTVQALALNVMRTEIQRT